MLRLPIGMAVFLFAVSSLASAQDGPKPITTVNQPVREPPPPPPQQAYTPPAFVPQPAPSFAPSMPERPYAPSRFVYTPPPQARDVIVVQPPMGTFPRKALPGESGHTTIGGGDDGIPILPPRPPKQPPKGTEQPPTVYVGPYTGEYDPYKLGLPYLILNRIRSGMYYGGCGYDEELLSSLSMARFYGPYGYVNCLGSAASVGAYFPEFRASTARCALIAVETQEGMRYKLKVSLPVAGAWTREELRTRILETIRTQDGLVVHTTDGKSVVLQASTIKDVSVKPCY